MAKWASFPPIQATTRPLMTTTPVSMVLTGSTAEFRSLEKESIRPREASHVISPFTCLRKLFFPTCEPLDSHIPLASSILIAN